MSDAIEPGDVITGSTRGRPMTIGSLFSGIGGLELGLERAGLGSVAWQCEIDPFCRSVLAKHWPDVRRFADVRDVHYAPTVGIVCGGFPCQDVSTAGGRAGIGGARSGLWSEYVRIVSETRPEIIIIENVLGLRARGLRRVLAEIADLGFDADWGCVSAAEIGAPHRRRRLFIVATHPGRVHARFEPGWIGRSCGAGSIVAAGHGAGRAAAHPRSDGWRRTPAGDWWPTVPSVRGMDDGLPYSLDGSGHPPEPKENNGRRLKSLGNAVVPGCAELIGRAIAAAIGMPATDERGGL